MKLVGLPTQLKPQRVDYSMVIQKPRFENWSGFVKFFIPLTPPKRISPKNHGGQRKPWRSIVGRGDPILERGGVKWSKMRSHGFGFCGGKGREGKKRRGVHGWESCDCIYSGVLVSCSLVHMGSLVGVGKQRICMCSHVLPPTLTPPIFAHKWFERVTAKASPKQKLWSLASWLLSLEEKWPRNPFCLINGTNSSMVIISWTKNPYDQGTFPPILLTGLTITLLQCSTSYNPKWF